MTTATAVAEEKRSDASKVKTNDLMAFIYYGTITKVDRGGLIVDVRDSDDESNEFEVKGEQLIEAAYSADQYKTVEHVGHTRAAEILVSAFNRPFTVAFTKLNGAKRVLRGRLVSSEHLLGRSMVEDLDLNSDEHRLRQVDHRTIEYLIVDGIKYET